MAYHHRHPRLSPICYCFAPPVQDRMTGRLPLMEKQTTAYHKPPCHCIQQSSLELMLTSQCGLYIRRLDYAWFPNNRKLSRDALKSCAAVFSSRCLYRASLAFADLVQFGLSMSAEVIGSPRLDVTLLFFKDSLQILAFLFQLLVHQAIDFERLEGTPKSRLGRTKGVLQMCNTKCLAV